MWRKYNANPANRQVGDCTVRAICAATGESWEATYCGIAVMGFCMNDMPSSNAVWGAYLRKKGFCRHFMPDTCPDCYTVADFCADHPHGTYILALSSHVVAVKDGDWLDTWDSGNEIPIFYWHKEE